MSNDYKSSALEILVVDEIRHQFSCLTEAQRLSFVARAGIHCDGKVLSEGTDPTCNDTEQIADSIEQTVVIQCILEELHKLAIPKIGGGLHAPPTPLTKSSRQYSFDKAMELLFSATTPDFSQGLQSCMEHLIDPRTATLAALFLLQGVGSPEDPERAVQILMPHLDVARAKALLAECYIFGKGVEKHLDRGFELLESAKSTNDLYAHLVAGDCARLGAVNTGVPDTDQAIKEYQRVFESDGTDYEIAFMKCLAKLRLAQAADVVPALAYLQEAARFGYPVAWYELGRTLIDEAKTDADRKLALTEIERAANAKYLPACLFMARNWSYPTSCPLPTHEPNLQKAVKYYLYAAEQGHPEFQKFATSHRMQLESIQSEDGLKPIIATVFTKALKGEADSQVNLGLCHHFGYGISQNHTQAFEWFLKAAHQKHTYAEFWVGRSYHIGQGVVKDSKQAVIWFLEAAKHGHADAQNNLGNCYHKGCGVPQDYTQAHEWYLKSSNQGDTYAQYNLGNCYYHGQGVIQDYIQAFDWYLKSATQGNAYAQNTIGNCYKKGHGVSQDYTKAFEWYSKAASQGNAYGQNNLGNCYKNGDGVAQDHTRAFEYYLLSAQQGYVNAQRSVANCYRMGHGVTQDLIKAKDWESKASKKAHLDVVACLAFPE